MIIVLLAIVVAIQSCTIVQQSEFRFKNLVNAFPIIADPYANPTQDYLRKVNESLLNKDQVCAVKYTDRNRWEYSIKTFDKISQLEPGFIVTHQGRCAACSTLQDLWVYLTTDLTRTVRKCGILHFYSRSSLRKCIRNLGFTDACTEVWMWNTLNTKRHCNSKCIWALLTNEPFVVDGQLNPCLQCDEDISGPIFKYESGRTRRNSGIHSEIDRPIDQIYNMTHCYY